jgi:hypothetical protein
VPCGTLQLHGSETGLDHGMEEVGPRDLSRLVWRIWRVEESAVHLESSLVDRKGGGRDSILYYSFWRQDGGGFKLYQATRLLLVLDRDVELLEVSSDLLADVVGMSGERKLLD